MVANYASPFRCPASKNASDELLCPPSHISMWCLPLPCCFGLHLKRGSWLIYRRLQQLVVLPLLRLYFLSAAPSMTLEKRHLAADTLRYYRLYFAIPLLECAVEDDCRRRLVTSYASKTPCILLPLPMMLRKTSLI